MSHYKPYPAYKESGVEWLGKVPEHWVVQKLKWFANLQSGNFITSESIRDAGTYPVYGGNGLRGYSDAFTHSGEYVLIGRQGALCGNINYASGDFWASEHAVVVSPYKKAVTRWLGELLWSMNLNQYSVSAAQPGLAVERILDLEIPVAPLNEQQAIATHLDRETARIDALVEKKTRFIGLLREKRQTLITLAVTKGLAPNAKMKDSGVEWLGEVPEHWKVANLSYASAIDTGATPDRNNPGYWNGDIPWVKTGEINWTPIAGTEEFITQQGLQESSCKLAEPGTLLMAMYGQGVTRGRVAILNVRAAYNQACAAIKVNKTLMAEFAVLFFIAAYRYIRESGNETSQMNLSAELVGKIKIPFPPLAEQKEIVRHSKSVVANIDSLILKTERSIELLKERRSALITAAVTGQIDLLDAA